MKKILSSLILATGLMTSALAFAGNVYDPNHYGAGRKTIKIAVFGDWPYNQNLLTNAPRLINSVNSEPGNGIKWVLHVGDIHSGSMPCTSAGILPPIASSVPDWNQKVYHQFQQFNAPVIYTPGDNEWTDCHKSKEQSSGDPLKELASVRNLFFAKPGYSLGVNEQQVVSQAQSFDSDHPEDAQFIENVIWMDSRVIFVTVNMPGSNNDTLPWSGSFSNTNAQTQEVSQRTNADIRWLDSAFDAAQGLHAKAIVIILQADMWDPAALTGDGLNAYTPFVQKLADLTTAFNRPVLLLNGDSHVYGSDHPLADPNSSTGLIHHTQAVPNLMRVTVQGSTNAPAEWLRLTIDSNTPNVFSWENVAYCKDPLGSCQ